jgi:hypothetical protein
MQISLSLFSYIDPVSGVILLQLFIGGCLGLSARFRHAIWKFCSRCLGRKPAEAAAPELPALSLAAQSLRVAGPEVEAAAFADPLASEFSREQQEFHKAA